MKPFDINKIFKVKICENNNHQKKEHGRHSILWWYNLPTNQPPIDTLVSPTHLHGRYLNINTTSNQPIPQLLGQLRKLVVSSDTVYLQQKITGCTLHLIPLSEAKDISMDSNGRYQNNPGSFGSVKFFFGDFATRPGGIVVFFLRQFKQFGRLCWNVVECWGCFTQDYQPVTSL